MCPRGTRRARVLDTPPPPLEIGRKVPDHRCKQNLLDVATGEKTVFSPHVSILNIFGIVGEFKKGQNLAVFS